MRYELKIYKPNSGTPEIELFDSFESAKDEVSFLIEHAIERIEDPDKVDWALTALGDLRESSADDGFHAEVAERTYICSKKPELRTAEVDLAGTRGITLKLIQDYLPTNYTAEQVGDTVKISGYDNAGWTLDGYVIPRLRSTLVSAKETTAQEVKR